MRLVLRLALTVTLAATTLAQLEGMPRDFLGQVKASVQTVRTSIIQEADRILSRAAYDNLKLSVDDIDPSISSENGAHTERSPGFFNDVKSTVDSIGTIITDAAGKAGATAQQFTEALIDGAAASYPDAAKQLQEFQTVLARVVSGAQELHAQFSTSAAQDGSKDDFNADLQQFLKKLLKDLQTAFPPPEKALGHTERVETVSKVLAEAQHAIMQFAIKHGIQEEHLHSHLTEFVGHLGTLIVLMGDITEQHPVLSSIVISAVLALLVRPLILRPFLRLLGFGLLGPTEASVNLTSRGDMGLGSFAAWAQSTFFGANVGKGSWFAILQSIGMRL
ncbi:uncharacterized protein FIBRA_04630 [Fibroporia radiculosa]|uniref:Uncharacterized protein n=1 Tax=Fibroporia radiculosa TaxID=599839 RepID=J4G7P2_9APHY|nr:uncharacterized protein FIBRA_04630 [Fibroporia radiculosa]CCM02528.1 predicted protein [Fibroporia radiculosa]